MIQRIRDPYQKKQRASVAVVSPTFNKYLETRKLILLLKKQTLKHDLIIVDNNSSDNSYSLITKEFPDIIVLKTKSNLGSGGGFYVGQKYAYDAGYDKIVLNDNDAYPVETDVLEILLKRSTPKNMVNPINISEMNPVNFTTLHMCMMDKDIIATGGFIDPKLFLYGDDTEYQLRLRKKGIGLIKIPRHYTHPMKFYYQPNMYYYVSRNLLFLNKFYRNISLYLSLWIQISYSEIFEPAQYASYIFAKQDLTNNIWTNDIRAHKFGNNKHPLIKANNKQIDKYISGKKLIVQSSKRIEQFLNNRDYKKIKTGYDLLSAFIGVIQQRVFVTDNINFVPFFSKTIFIYEINKDVATVFIVKSNFLMGMKYLFNLMINVFKLPFVLIRINKSFIKLRPNY